jgi:Cof subfamily protein (haloacid dehalogenase superfamily)
MLKMTSVVDDIEFDGYVANNGATCYDSNKKMIFHRPLPQDQLDAVAARLADKSKPQFALSFMGQDDYYINRHSKVAEEIARQVNVEPPILMPVKEIIKKNIYQLCIYLQGTELQNVMDEALTGCEARAWNPLFADVNEAGITKEYGIDRILEYFNLQLSDTMSFGDGANDIPMLRHTALSICMGNANAEVEKASDYKTSTVDNGGIVSALRHYNIL